MTGSEAIDGIVKIVTVVTLIALAVIAYMQIKIAKKQTSIDAKVDGHITKLMESTASGDVAKGKLEEKEHSEIKTDALVDKLVEASKAITPKPE